ncbi:MAG: phosphatidate cytidylyltransferase [Acutalibacteraceae bacterium]
MKQRIITSIFGIILVLVWLALRDTIVFNIIIALVLLIAMLEALVGTKIVKNKPLLAVSMMFSVTVPFFQLFRFYPAGIALSSLYIFALLIILLWQHEKLDLRQVTYAFTCATLIPFALSSLLYTNAISVHDAKYTSTDGLFLVLLAMIGAWIADTGAYFAGRFFGRHKLAPKISPKKTIEGAVGGVLAVVIVYLGVGLVWQFGFLKDSASLNFWLLLLLAVLNSVCGIIGDLTFSCIKREAGIKDFGSIMPGHGGILDRCDSLIITAPCTLFFVHFFPLLVK